MDQLQGAGGVRVGAVVLLAAAVLLSGLVAGLFFSFAMSVMPALEGADDRTFVDTMQRINVAIINPWFGIVFGGAPAAQLAAAVAYRGDQRVLPWVLAGLACYIAMLAVTMVVNVPLNERLAKAGAVDHIAYLAAARGIFQTRWVRWNVVRAVLSAASFGCLVLGLAVRR